jgi:hypothetical protein
MLDADSNDVGPPSKSGAGGTVVVVSALHRFAVKGLERDSLQHVDLAVGGAFPFDRRWALLFDNAPNRFAAASPQWLHKSNFLCAFSANQLMAMFVTRFDDASRTFTLSRRGQQLGAAPLLSADLDDAAGRDRVAAFFSNESGRAVRVVSDADPSSTHHHQFGNTGSGVKRGDGSTRTIHIVNANTVRALSAAAGIPLHADRFRANIILEGALPAWKEFEWVGRTIRLGGAALRVLAQTVRCEGVDVDARHGTGAADLSVPALLQQHFPQHGPYLGVYAQVVGGGAVRVGDPVRGV